MSLVFFVSTQESMVGERRVARWMQDTSKDFFLSLVYSREEMQDAKGVVGWRALFVGLDRKKGVCSGRGVC